MRGKVLNNLQAPVNNRSNAGISGSYLKALIRLPCPKTWKILTTEKQKLNCLPTLNSQSVLVFPLHESQRIRAQVLLGRPQVTLSHSHS